MSYPRFLVTFCVMGTEAGGNPLGHACLLLSKQDSANDLLEVVDAVGFYSQKGQEPDSLFNRLKNKLGFDFDIANVFGRWQFEELRWLDRGGLAGKSFELPEEQFRLLCKNIKNRMDHEQQVIDEISEKLMANDIDVNGTTVYEEELRLNPHPNDQRLKPFNFQIDLTRGGISTDGSNNCKTEAINQISQLGLDTQTDADKLHRSNLFHGVPAYSGGMLPVTLFATGELKAKKRRNGLNAYSRRFFQRAIESDVKETMSEPERANRLFWLLPPMDVNRPDHIDSDAFVSGNAGMSLQKYQRLQKLLQKIQALEFKIIKYTDHPLLLEFKQDLQQQLDALYLKIAQKTIQPSLTSDDIDSIMQEAKDMRWKLAAIRAKQDHQIYYDLALNISVAVVSVALISAASAAMAASLTFGAVPIVVPSLIIATALITLKWAAFSMYNNIKLETYKKDLPADLFESKAKLEMESKDVAEENQAMAINTM